MRQVATFWVRFLGSHFFLTFKVLVWVWFSDNAQMKIYFTLSTEYLLGDNNDASNNNNKSKQGKNKTQINDATPKIFMPEIESTIMDKIYETNSSFHVK